MTTYKTIADLPAAVVLSATDQLELSQAGISRAATLGQVIGPVSAAARYGVSPYAYGGTGNGVADDSAAVAAAIASGRGVDLSGGTWAVKGLTISALATCPGLFSDGSGQVTAATGSTSSDNLFTVLRSDFTVSGIFFNMPISTTPGSPPACNTAVYFAGAAATARQKVTDCRCVGGRQAFAFGGLSASYMECSRNVITNTWGQAIGVDQPVFCLIADNEITDGGFDSTASSGAIRVGSSGQTEIAENIVISRNIIRRYNQGFQQEGIDITCNGARSVVCSDNIISDTGNGGIELKTSAIALAPDVYQQFVIANNHIRITNPTASVGIACNHSAVGTAGKAAMLKITGNLIAVDADVAVGVGVYGIVLNCWTDADISSNTILHVARGVQVSGAGETGTTLNHIYIKDNVMRCVNNCILSGSGTMQDFWITGNDLYSSLGRTVTFDSMVVNNATITGNTIQSGATFAMEIRDLHDSLIERNTIRAGGTDSSILSSGTVSTNVTIRNNTLVATGAAVNVSTGTGFVIAHNDVTIPINTPTATGAGTYISINNRRGSATADPSATTAGTRGDVFYNSAPASAGAEKWICTVAGSAGAATYKSTVIS